MWFPRILRVDASLALACDLTLSLLSTSASPPPSRPVVVKMIYGSVQRVNNNRINVHTPPSTLPAAQLLHTLSPAPSAGREPTAKRNHEKHATLAISRVVRFAHRNTRNARYTRRSAITTSDEVNFFHGVYARVCVRYLAEIRDRRVLARQFRYRAIICTRRARLYKATNRYCCVEIERDASIARNR